MRGRANLAYAAPAPRSARAACSERPSDQLLHDFVAPGVDALHPAVGPHARDRVLAQVAVAAVQLQALVDDPALGLGEPVLGDRGARLVEQAGEKARDAAVEENAPDVHLGLAFGELEAGVLLVEEGLAERLAFLHVARGERHRLLRGGNRADRDLQPLVGKLLHHLREAAAFDAAEEVRRRHARLVEEKLASVLPVHADLLQGAPDAVAGEIPGLDHHERDGAHAGHPGVGLQREAHEVGVRAVGDERLRAVDDVVLALAARRCLDRLQVRARPRLGHRDRGDALAASEARQPLALLFLGAVGEDVVRDGALDPAAEVHARARELLQHHRLVREAAAAAAVLLGEVGEQDPRTPRARPRAAVGTARLAPARLLRDEFLLDELAHGVAKHAHVVVYPRGLIVVARHGWSAPYLRCASAAMKPGRGEKLSRRQPAAAARRQSSAAAGMHSPSPRAFASASLRVQTRRNPSVRSCGARASQLFLSRRVKRLATIAGPSGTGPIASTSTPTSPAREKAYTASSSRRDRLKRQPRAAKRPASAAFPFAPYSKAIDSGGASRRCASSSRSRARATTKRRRSRSNRNRVALARSSPQSRGKSARTISGGGSRRVVTISTFEAGDMRSDVVEPRMLTRGCCTGAR